MRQDRKMRRWGNYIILKNIYMARLRHWDEEEQTEKPEHLAPPFSLWMLNYRNRETKRS
jgi:hypothetical protein